MPSLLASSCSSPSRTFSALSSPTVRERFAADAMFNRKNSDSGYTSCRRLWSVLTQMSRSLPNFETIACNANFCELFSSSIWYKRSGREWVLIKFVLFVYLLSFSHPYFCTVIRGRYLQIHPSLSLHTGRIALIFIHTQFNYCIPVTFSWTPWYHA